MKLFPRGMPRVSLAGSMIGIAMIGLILGGAAWLRSAWPRVEARSRAAVRHRSEALRWRQVPGWIDVPGLSARSYPNSERPTGGTRIDGHPPSIYQITHDRSPAGKVEREFVRSHRDEILALGRDRVAYHERMSGRWRFAAWAPWTTDPTPGDPEPPIYWGEPVDQSY